MTRYRSVLLGAAAALLTGIAFGHAKLLSTTPGADAVLEAPPHALSLTFNEDVRLATLSLSDGGRDIALHIDRSAAAAPTVAIPLPVLAPGHYQVRWSALSPNDGHVVKGTFSFSVAAAESG